MDIFRGIVMYFPSLNIIDIKLIFIKIYSVIFHKIQFVNTTTIFEENTIITPPGIILKSKEKHTQCD